MEQVLPRSTGTFQTIMNESAEIRSKRRLWMRHTVEDAAILAIDDSFRLVRTVVDCLWFGV